MAFYIESISVYYTIEISWEIIKNFTPHTYERSASIIQPVTPPIMIVNAGLNANDKGENKNGIDREKKMDT